MSVAVFVKNQSDAALLIPWGARFARADESNLLIVVARKSKSKEAINEVAGSDDVSESALLTAVFEAAKALDSHLFTQALHEGQEQDPRTLIEVREIVSRQPESAFTDSIKDLNIRLLMLPAHEPSKSSGDDNWVYNLLSEAPCETILIRGSFPQEDSPLAILVATQGESDTDIALERGRKLVEKFEGQLSVLFVRPDDNRIAMQVARMQLERLDQDTRIDLSELPKTIILKEDLRSAIKDHCSKNEYHLVLVGTRKLKQLRSVLRPWEAGDALVPVAAVRGGVPFSSRLWNGIQIWFRSRVPQLHRDQRIKLIDRLQSNSSFDFDFIALSILSTMIAALGLVQNSGAVVIGAMLVAPLMNPLAAIGYSLALGNVRLIRNAMSTVAFGFAVALLIGIGIGLMVEASHYLGLILYGIDCNNSELQARGHPNLLDWFVAFVSGIAAAYAMGRPKLLSALPGVAIAAALVPPIATSGLALATLNFQLSIGALLLFFTNIVAIVLGTAVAFWAVGIGTGSKEKMQDNRSDPAWPRYLFLSFVILSIVLATAMSRMNRQTLSEHNKSRSETPGVLQSVILGDLNGDGLVTLLDVAPFVESLASGEFVPAADINQDGVSDLLDLLLCLRVEHPLIPK